MDNIIVLNTLSIPRKLVKAWAFLGAEISDQFVLKSISNRTMKQNIISYNYCVDSIVLQ
jgi:hypothetical protein